MELTWLQFKNQSHIRILNENEQVRQYSFYLDSLINQRIRQNKGARRSTPQDQEGSEYLLQENSDYILQEDGSKVYWN
jgi:hypothetical protein